MPFSPSYMTRRAASALPLLLLCSLCLAAPRTAAADRDGHDQRHAHANNNGDNGRYNYNSYSYFNSANYCYNFIYSYFANLLYLQQW